MIYLGLDGAEKVAAIADYCTRNQIKRTFILSPEKFTIPQPCDNCEIVEWANIIEYAFYYRLLQEIDKETLVVVNECLRTQNRYELTYNCIRLFLNQTPHKLIFQYLPLIDTIDDFMVLFDFDTRSQWKRDKFNRDLLKHCTVAGYRIPVQFQAVSVTTDAKTKLAYTKEKRKLIDNIGLKDPHTIPRNLYLLSGKAKLAWVVPEQFFIGRNNRFKLGNLQTYREKEYQQQYEVFEFCHNFIDFADFVSLSRTHQASFSVLVADLKVDQWYFQRYTDWAQRLHDAYSILSLQKNRP